MARRDDPDTSHEAAKRANPERARRVADLLKDGIPRTDEQIAEAAQLTISSACHGRLVLERAGKLELVGKTTTSNGGRARMWKWRGT